MSLTRPVPFGVTSIGTWLMLAGSCILAGADKSRDLSQYDVAGPYLIQYGTPEADRLSGQMREFLWTHWRQHRRGTIVATHFYVDGSAKTSYFVESDKQGHWVIVEYTDYPVRGRKQAALASAQRFSCAEFERVEPDRLRLPLIPIPDLEPRQPEAYLLHPICRKGKNAKLCNRAL